MSITTIADGCYIDVNESFLDVSGYSRKELIGRTSLELNIWETPQNRADFIQQVKERGSVVNVETRLQARDRISQAAPVFRRAFGPWRRRMFAHGVE
jgi:PAS domain S-box-containing protein